MASSSPSKPTSLMSTTTEAKSTETTSLLHDDDHPTSQNGFTHASNEPFHLLPWYRRPSIFWVLGPFFFLAIAFGGIIVPRLNLLLSLICKHHLEERTRWDPTYVVAPVVVLDADNPQCRIPEVQAKVATFSLYISVITGVMSAIMSPKIGALSDRYGRTRCMALASTGLVLSEVVAVLAAKFPERITFHWFLLGAFLDGVFGSFTAVMAIIFAYASDCTPPHRRAVAFSYFHASLFAGMALGPLSAAIVLRTTGQLIYLFYIAIGSHLVFMGIIIFVVPESLSQHHRKAARADALSSTTAQQSRSVFGLIMGLFEPLRILWPTGPGTSIRLRRNMSLLAMIDTISFGIAMGGMTVVVYYVGYTFGWSSAESSVFMSISSISRVTGLLVLLPTLQYLLTRRARAKEVTAAPLATATSPHLQHTGASPAELTIIRIALFIEVIGVAGYALSPNGHFFILSSIFAALGGICAPTLQGVLTKHVPAERVGQLLGATGLLHALARVVAPVATNFVYARTVKGYPWAIFIVLSAFYGVAFVASFLLRSGVSFNSTPAISADLPGDDTETAPGAPLISAEVEAEVLLEEDVVVM